MNNQSKKTLIEGELPSSLRVDFKELFELRPKERSSVTLYDKNKKQFENKEIFRAYKCYLEVPEFNSEVKKSYMFLNKEESVPDCLKKYIEFAKSLDSKYNQMVVNWYSPEDYIEPHRDCTSSFIDKEADILTINLNEDDSQSSCRDIVFQNVETNDLTSKQLKNNHYYILKNNSTHRHSVGVGNSKRVSITFRKIKV